MTKRQRRLSSVDEVVLSLYAKGMTTGEILAHFSELYGASVSKDTISRITDTVIGEMDEWANRPLEAVYCAIFIDAIMVKVRDGQVANRPVYAAIGVTVDGRKDVLGLWMGRAGRPEKPRRAGCVLPRLRRPQRTAGSRGKRVAADPGANVRHPRQHPAVAEPPSTAPAGTSYWERRIGARSALCSGRTSTPMAGSGWTWTPGSTSRVRLTDGS